MKNWDDLIHAYALKNAIEHEGKALSNSVLSSLFHEGLKKEEVKNIIKNIQKIVNEVNSKSLEQQKEELENKEKLISHRKEREGLPDLENVKGKVIMRFSPSPSGPMHIGHAATGMPTSLYVKKYSGKFYLRIEDTNPENIDKDAYKMIPEEADWLFGNVSEVYCQSDRIKKYYNLAEELIKKSAAYVCTCESEKFKELIEDNMACDCRSLNAKEQMKRWGKMLDKKGYKEGQAVLRFKSDLNDPNPAMRDFPLARINLHNHPKQKKKYRVWPLMNLCVSQDDMEFNITHVIRAKDHIDNAKRQEMIFKVFNKKAPISYFLGRYNFTDMEISCSKTKKLIKKGKYSSWEDIRLPFIAALRKRGYQADAFAKMAEQRGISEVDKVLTKEEYFELLDNFNRELLKDKVRKVEYSFSKIKNYKVYELLMPDNKKKKIYIAEKVKDNEIVFFSGLGYAKLNKNVFWFAHK